MSELLRIAKGLKATYKNARDYTLSQALLEVEKYTDNYEVLNPTHNRLYGDVDGKNIEGSEKEFVELDMKTKDAIVSFLKDESYCLLTASSFLHKKISWRFVITNRKATLEDNKTWVQQNIELIDLPEGITFDTAPYGKNQKIRMVGSNKDGENRPLRLIEGEIVDSLISYIPQDCMLMEFAKEKKTRKNKKENTDEKIQGKLLVRLVMNITNDETTDWQTWYRVAQAIYNEGGDEELFMEWSSKSSKHSDREALLQWKSLKDNTGNKLTAGSLFYWSNNSNPVEHEKIILECCSKDEYQYQKIVFEKNHFKLMNPYCIIRIYEKEIIQYNEGDFRSIYRNKTCGDEDFVTKWFKDPNIRTYEKLVFEVDDKNIPDDCFNIFKGWNYDAIEGDISAVRQVLRLICNNDTNMMMYIEKWLACILQQKEQKTSKCIVIQGEQGVGKDTFFDFVGSMFGDYFYNTGNPEVDVFGTFNSHLMRTIFLKFEEASFLTNKSNDTKLKNILSAPLMSFHPKGQKPFTLKSFVNCVMTTNQFIPVLLEDTDRRFVLVQASSEKRGDLAFWRDIHNTLAKKETKQAYLYHLLHLDLNGFDVRSTDQFKTEYHKEVALAERPFHARFLQDRIAEEFQLTFRARDLWKMMKENCRFDISETSFGRAMKIYEGKSMTKRRMGDGHHYEFDREKLIQQLKQKNWWNDEFE